MLIWLYSLKIAFDCGLAVRFDAVAGRVTVAGERTNTRAVWTCDRARSDETSDSSCGYERADYCEASKSRAGSGRGECDRGGLAKERRG